MIDFDPGYVAEPYLSLCRQYDSGEYPPDAFRVDWGPVFHRGRLDGSARVLVIGQDPAAQEAVARRILVGTAGHRVQGFLRKLGLTKSYVMLNAFAFSVLEQAGGEHNKNNPAIVGYRNRWFDAVFAPGKLQAVIAFGALAHHAWDQWLTTANGKAHKNVPFQAVRHPTSPESSGAAQHTNVKAATKAMLAQWNTAIEALRQADIAVDEPATAPLYGDAFTAGDLPLIPDFDLPAGLPAWMRGADGWAKRTGATAEEKRRTLTIVIPQGA